MDILISVVHMFGYDKKRIKYMWLFIKHNCIVLWYDASGTNHMSNLRGRNNKSMHTNAQIIIITLIIITFIITLIIITFRVRLGSAAKLRKWQLTIAYRPRDNNCNNIMIIFFFLIDTHTNAF